jgi:hypothetical protein
VRHTTRIYFPFVYISHHRCRLCRIRMHVTLFAVWCLDAGEEMKTFLTVEEQIPVRHYWNSSTHITTITRYWYYSSSDRKCLGLCLANCCPRTTGGQWRSTRRSVGGFRGEKQWYNFCHIHITNCNCKFYYDCQKSIQRSYTCLLSGYVVNNSRKCSIACSLVVRRMLWKPSGPCARRPPM